LSENEVRPGWLRKEKRLSPEVLATRRKVKTLGLHTVCQSARCPNVGECFCSGNATFLILGERCTRDCAFCAVDHGSPGAPDPEEGRKIAAYIEAAGTRFAVITSVTRDDLADGGAGHFERVVRDIRSRLPKLGIELLVPDFKGRPDLIARVAGLPIEVFGHNLETVPRLYAQIRRGADYARSLTLLRRAAAVLPAGRLLKTGIMLGLGEKPEDLDPLFADLVTCGVDILTMGQYLRPTQKNSPVRRYYHPDEFAALKSRAEKQGIPTVVAGPYVRSSYLAEEHYLSTLRKSV
jgi:lipoic acid synthetase